MGSVSKYSASSTAGRSTSYGATPTEFPGSCPTSRPSRTAAARGHWEVDGPLGTTVSWDTEIVEDLREALAWKSVGGQVRNASCPLRRSRRRDGPEYAMEFDPPGGTAARWWQDLQGPGG